MKAICRVLVGVVMYLVMFATILPAQHEFSGHTKDEQPAKPKPPKPPKTKQLKKKNQPIAPWNKQTDTFKKVKKPKHKDSK